MATNYLGTTDVPTQVKILMGTPGTVINNAIPGQQVSEIIAAFDAQTVALHGPELVKTVMVRAGINDYYSSGQTAAQVVALYKTLAGQVHDAGARIAICQLTGIGDNHADPSGGTTFVNELNASMDADHSYMDYYINMVTTTPSLSNANDVTLFLTDGIHETTAGRVLEASATFGILQQYHLV